MKNIKIIIAVSVVALLLGGLAIAQVHRGTGWSHAALQQQHSEPQSVVDHLGQAFPKIAAFDANKDGQLDAQERAALAKAIDEGTLQLPMHAAPSGHGPDAEAMVEHIGEMYGRVATYDANHDGTLDPQEQAAIKTALENGDLVWPHGH